MNLAIAISDGKESACNAGDLGSIPGQEDPLEKEMATHSSILAWRIPWKRGLAGYHPWNCKEWDTTEWLSLLTIKAANAYILFDPAITLLEICLTDIHFAAALYSDMERSPRYTVKWKKSEVLNVHHATFESKRKK